MDKKLKLAYLTLVLFLCAGWDTCWLGRHGPDPEVAGLAAVHQTGTALSSRLAPADEPALLAEKQTAVKMQNARDKRLSPTAASANIGDELFVSPALSDRVKLWEMVYADYDRCRLILYHRDRPGIVYAVIKDFPGLKDREIARLRARLYALERIAARYPDPVAEIKRRPDGEELLALYRKFEGVSEICGDSLAPDPRVFGEAARSGKIRVLRGRKGEFVQAYQKAGPYLPGMEQMFRSRGLPPELTRMVFVESMFDRDAVSSAGAVGVWQVLEDSARPYLVITRTVDERRDPMAATRAAAQILRFNYQRLGTWPLAVTAYNAGANRMIRAVRRTGSSSLHEIFENYEHRAFGFAVENFYAQVIAVIRAEKKLGLAPEQARPTFNPLDYDLIRLPSPFYLSSLSARLGMEPQMLIAFNPAWTRAIERNQLPVPAGYLLRVPRGSDLLVRAALGLPTTDDDQRPEPKSARAGERPSDRRD